MSKEALKIAVVIPKYGLVGGAEGFTASLTELLALNPRYDIHVFAHRWQKLSERVTFHPVPWITFPRFMTTISFAWHTGRLISRLNFDLIHSHERILKADIFTMHGVPHRFWIKEVRRKRMTLYDYSCAWVERRLLAGGNVRHLLAVSGLVKEKYLLAYPNLRPDDISIVSPGVDLERFQKLDGSRCRREIRAAYGIGEEEVVILFVSMNFEIKGLDRLMAALAAIKSTCPREKVRLLVVGKGDVKKYRKLALSLGIGDGVVFTGVMGTGQLERFYLASDIFSILSLFDTFALVVLEAMAAGLPVVITNNVGARDIVREGENGFVVKDGGDIEAIKEALIPLLNKQVRKKMAFGALQTAGENSWEVSAARVASFYDKVSQSLVNSKIPQP